ncbi:hypothetical protein B0T21DRAFT_350794 [Apiosordaria backusii]|uniref:Uncharacterized protein n=1 Tax=Apiosordaria backusii TaxID=314023 RepID=A0AA40B2X2_9PEZI|nr:hypothetical protein B0T21DRAFT_350794 [Apiosordaria backusii]
MSIRTLYDQCEQLLFELNYRLRILTPNIDPPSGDRAQMEDVFYTLAQTHASFQVWDGKHGAIEGTLANIERSTRSKIEQTLKNIGYTLTSDRGILFTIELDPYRDWIRRCCPGHSLRYDTLFSQLRESVMSSSVESTVEQVAEEWHEIFYGWDSRSLANHVGYLAYCVEKLRRITPPRQGNRDG